MEACGSKVMEVRSRENINNVEDHQNNKVEVHQINKVEVHQIKPEIFPSHVMSHCPTLSQHSISNDSGFASYGNYAMPFPPKYFVQYGNNSETYPYTPSNTRSPTGHYSPNQNIVRYHNILNNILSESRRVKNEVDRFSDCICTMKKELDDLIRFESTHFGSNMY